MSHLSSLPRSPGAPRRSIPEQVESVVDIGEVTAVPRALSACLAAAWPSRRSAWRAAAQRRAVITHRGHHYAMLVDALGDVALFDSALLAHGVMTPPGVGRADRRATELTFATNSCHSRACQRQPN